MNDAAMSMVASLAEEGVDIHVTTATAHIKAAQHNNCVGVSPQKPGGVLLPSHIEKNLADIVKALRQRLFPLFPDKVMQWAADMTKGT